MFILWISMCLQSLMKFHHCLFKTLRKNQMSRTKNAHHTKWLSLISSHFPKKYFFFHDTSSCTLLNISVLYLQSIRKLQSKLWYKLIPPCMYYLSTSNTCKQEIMAIIKFTKLSFCQKKIFWHQTSACKCSMCLQYVGKVSDGFSKNSGTS